ncbi:MAG: ABC transporter permease subunit [Vicinamibacteria bacterium]
MSSSRSLDRLGLGLFVLLVLAPVAASLAYAALYGVGLAGLLSRGFTLEHWRRVAGSGEVWTSVGLSLFVAAAVVALTTALALPMALALRRRLEAGPLAYALSLPLAIPGTVAALLTVQLLASAGLVSRICYRLGLIDGIAAFPSLVQDRWGLGIVATHTALAVPFFVLLFAELHAHERIEALRELAASLGASHRQTLVRVTLPILLRRAVPGLALLFVSVLGSFEIPLLVGRQAPQMLSVLAWRKYALFDLSQKPEAYILAVGYTTLAFVVVGLALRGRLLADER